MLRIVSTTPTVEDLLGGLKGTPIHAVVLNPVQLDHKARGGRSSPSVAFLCSLLLMRVICHSS